MHSILILHSYYVHFHDGKVLTVSRNAGCSDPCDKECSLPNMSGVPPSLLFCKVISHHGMAYAVHIDFYAPSNYASQSLSVFVVKCHDGFAWDFTYIGQVAAQALHSVFLLLQFERKILSRDPERLCIEAWDFCICF